MREKRKSVQNVATGKALMPIDASARRRAELAEYLQHCEELNRLSKKMQQFEVEERPAYMSWLETEFPAELEEYRKLNKEVSQLQEQIHRVHNYAGMLGISLAKAYRILAAARESGTEAELYEKALEDSEEPEKPEEYLRRAVSEGWDEPVLPPANSQLKSIYRQLVRKLHPDLNQQSSSENQKIWHVVQEAYSARDVIRLEQLLKTVNGEKAEATDFKSIPIGEIIEIRLEVESRLDLLKYNLRNLQKESGWGFFKTLKDKKRFQIFRKKTHSYLLNDFRQLIDDKVNLEEEIESLKTPRYSSQPNSKKIQNQLDFFDEY